MKDIVSTFSSTSFVDKSTSIDSNEVGSTDTNEIEPPLKKFRHLSKMVSKQLSKKKDTLSNSTEEVDLFIEQRNKNGPQQINALDYWVKCESMFPTLSKVACDIAVVPASSAPIERIFSTAGDSCFGKRNRLTSTNLEREVLIKKNKVYLNI